MIQTLIVTVGAGLAGALLFVVSAKGSLAAVFVTWFTPLPIMIVALGWHQRNGLIAAVLGAVLIAVFIHPLLGAMYGVGFGLPAWWLSYLVLLARFETGMAAETPADVRRHWYPVGRIAFWGCLLAAAIVSLAVLTMIAQRGDFDDVASDLAAEIAPLVEMVLGGRDRLPPGTTPESLARAAIVGLPVATAASLTLLYLTNLWLAGRTVQLSHRLTRPWPDLPDHLRLPRIATLALPLAIAVAILSWAVWGRIGVFAMIVASALTTAFALQGLALLHARTRGWSARIAVLVAIYMAILLTVWPLLGCALLGFADAVFSLRHQSTARPSPPRP